MNCKKCGSNIEENQNFCTNCGANLKNCCFTKKMNKKYIFVIAISIILLFVLLGFILQKKNLEDITQGTYKSITPIETAQIENLSTTELLNIAIKQDKDLSGIINKLSLQNADMLFETFYNNLSILVGSMHVDDLEVELQSNGFYKLTPETEIIGYEVNDWTGIWINHKYLNNKYSKYLSAKWQKFLKLTAKNLIYDVNVPYSINLKDLVRDIKSWQKFISEYPDFSQINIAQKAVQDETKRVLWNEYMFIDTDDGSMGKDYRQGYEEYLKKINKDCDEYKVVKQCYETLKNNNFKENSKYYEILYNFTGEEFFNERYIAFLDTEYAQEKTKAIENYENLNFDKENFIKIYKKAKEYADLHIEDKDESGAYLYACANCYNGLVREYFEKNDKEALRVYDIIDNYCFAVNQQASMADVRNCFSEKLNNTVGN